jgi:pyruvate/2-oxoglutarate dehydrogenase complex dihydrolipoamide dehydrogenase (E3) component
VGGGLVGTEVAIYLAGLGKSVTVVEMRDDFAVDAAEMHKIALEKELRRLNIPMKLNTRAKAVTETGLLCTGPDGKDITLEADAIMIAVGRKPDTESVEALRYAAPRFLQIGDCIRPGKVLDAVHGGYYGALDI